MGNLFSRENAGIAVLFDFDGTIGDTETPAMKIAFWEIAPYLANFKGNAEDETKYVQENAGKAFEFMVEECEAERKKKGLKTIEEARKENQYSTKVLNLVDAKRAEFGLKSLSEVAAENGGELPEICQQQKEETNIALATMAHPNPGVPEVLALLKEGRIPFCIATTSPKPRVPISITSCGFDSYFPAEKVHSGESDFNPPRFKPAPDVYLKAAEAERTPPSRCVAVEDSASGVGSAANAKVGLILGYVGSSHIPAAKKEGHARSLMAGEKAEDGRGAEVVLMDFADVHAAVVLFRDWHADRGKLIETAAAAMEEESPKDDVNKEGPTTFPELLRQLAPKVFAGKHWFP
mmetsp:Transcript_43616/g.76906  ORF Transcript_43616/g.76906 Transcript_43616/m.76906 type:complete len:349 (+) Transcript_43616:107-1153(+)|eukprot:CAMPEP_0194587574 /NCGR_PEP_ID=MMETSP0292-20121207/19238_1 /TAXON_ID=39354 /ORGANISM="Heterosigma akashiwo, Strain CCMP2393" /LENGTH=348 /DNA_ID=CAMNT_0039443857 /DNA_START=80 /DNA_END=1129 /DNA_ORIENTATION=-